MTSDSVEKKKRKRKKNKNDKQEDDIDSDEAKIDAAFELARVWDRTQSYIVCCQHLLLYVNIFTF